MIRLGKIGVILIFIFFISFLVYNSFPANTKIGDSIRDIPNDITKLVDKADGFSDVTLGVYTQDTFGGIAGTGGFIDVTYINSSSERVDYLVDLAVESIDGTIQYATEVSSANNIEPGMTKMANVRLYDNYPEGSVIRIKSVKRTVAN